MADIEAPVSTISTGTKTALYRHFDSAGNLLYVGISLSAIVRLRAHRSKSHWFDEIASLTTEWHPSREAAIAAEKKAIETERPRFNVVHNKREQKNAEKVVDLGPMPWGPYGKPLYEGQKPCPIDLQAIFYKKELSALAR